MPLVPMRAMLDRKAFACNPAEFDPRSYLGAARDAMKQVCVARMVAFGQAGHAGEIKPVTCGTMVSFYRRKQGPESQAVR